MQIKTFQFEAHGDDRGQLIALEEHRDIPFPIRRVYYIFDTKQGVRRGFHAHRNLEQVLICVHGSCKILLDDGADRQTVTLDDNSVGLYIANNMWREMFDFSPDAVLLVLASQPYDESDYIRDYDEFLSFVRKETGEKS